MLLKIYIFWKFEDREPQSHEVKGDLRLKQPQSYKLIALGQISLQISGNAYFEVR